MVLLTYTMNPITMTSEELIANYPDETSAWAAMYAKHFFKFQTAIRETKRFLRDLSEKTQPNLFKSTTEDLEKLESRRASKLSHLVNTQALWIDNYIQDAQRKS
jgi:hypothetical protein